MRSSDIRVVDVAVSYEDYNYRTPIKFGGLALDKVTLLNVEVVVETRSGEVAFGFGSMPMGNIWSFPSTVLSYDQTLHVMKVLAQEIARITAAYSEAAHPLDINWQLEPAYLKAAEEISRNLDLAQPIPKLCTLVVASAFDAALHDGFGKASGITCYQGYSEEYLPYDLGHYLGPEFAGDRLDRHILPRPKACMPVYHLVGALDPIWDRDISARLDDGLPETLGEWLLADGLTHIKIKLNGDNLDWDVHRVLEVDEAVSVAETQRRIGERHYSLDFNEKCPDVAYLLDFLGCIRAASETLFGCIHYIEQPTARDLNSSWSHQIRKASVIKPVVIDESLVDFESLLLARQLGYTGVALKACKGQTNALLMAAAAQKFGMFLCVQDLTCPGASLIQSAGLAAHVPAVSAIEANARQYVPAANKAWKARFPSIFTIRNGIMRTGVLEGPGLGAIPPRNATRRGEKTECIEQMHQTEVRVPGIDGDSPWAAERRLRLSVAARNFAAIATAESLRKIAEIGFDTVDNFNWRDEAEFGLYRELLPRLGLGAGVLVVNKVPDVNALGCSLVSPADREGFLREVELCVAAARQVNCTRLEVLTGNELPGVPRAVQMDNCVAALRAAVPLLRQNGMTVELELLNNTVDHPGYFLNYVRDGIELIERVASPQVKLLFDIYHVQIMEGNLIARLVRNIEHIGQIHFADVPGRHEPGTGEINYRNVFKAIYELGERYTGYVTAEYEPTDCSFRDLKAVKELATFT